MKGYFWRKKNKSWWQKESIEPKENDKNHVDIDCASVVFLSLLCKFLLILVDSINAQLCIGPIEMTCVIKGTLCQFYKITL